MKDEMAIALKAMLEAWEDQFGPDACDCMPEPQNAGHVCQCCQARNALETFELQKSGKIKLAV